MPFVRRLEKSFGTKHVVLFDYFRYRRASRLTSCLTVFGIKYTNKDDIDDLFREIKDKYPLKIDWSGAKYVGIDLNWDYEKQAVKLSMNGYIERALK